MASDCNDPVERLEVYLSVYWLLNGYLFDKCAFKSIEVTSTYGKDTLQ